MSAPLHVVIVNYRTADLALQCLESLARQDCLCKVTVIDNDSRDGSAEKLEEAVAAGGWSDWIGVVRAGRNGGFAFGNNIGIGHALAQDHVEYVLLLNPDTIVHGGALRALLEFARARPDVGIVGARLENAGGQVECSAHNAPSPLGELEGTARLGPLSRLLERYAVSPPPRDAAHRCEWVSGASMLIRRAVIEQVGLLDEGFFLYFEEVDFCTRAREAGWQVWHEPAARVVHLEGASTGIQHAARARPAYWFESRRRYFVKHHGALGLLAADVLWGVGHLSLRLRRAMGLGSGGETADPPRLARDLLCGDLGAAWRGQIASSTCKRHSRRRHTSAT